MVVQIYLYLFLSLVHSVYLFYCVIIKPSLLVKNRSMLNTIRCNRGRTIVIFNEHISKSQRLFEKLTCEGDEGSLGRLFIFLNHWHFHKATFNDFYELCRWLKIYLVCNIKHWIVFPKIKCWESWKSFRPF